MNELEEKMVNDLITKLNLEMSKKLEASVDEINSYRKAILGILGSKNKQYQKIKRVCDTFISNLRVRVKREESGISVDEMIERANDIIKIANNSIDPVALRQLAKELQTMIIVNGDFLEKKLRDNIWKNHTNINNKAFYFENKEKIDARNKEMLDELNKVEQEIKTNGFADATNLLNNMFNY